eukprot:TRINITY_DN63410_c0_g1_i1.p1 TRINITY_DN63410_c0_g1~~TRINITY_DN63410_c0_g1_i1.p1  ORF type:complete len:525 (-),score=104.85 TRINITY_DN63410_c0_g1_i1:117-1691(-)
MVLAPTLQASLGERSEGYGAQLRKRLDANVAKKLGCQVKTFVMQGDRPEPECSSLPIKYEEVCQKEQPERFRMLVQQGRMPERSAEGKLVIRLDAQQDVWARLRAPRPLSHKQTEHEASKPRLDGQATRELVKRLTEHRSCVSTSEQTECEPADGQRFRDAAEQQAHIDRLVRPRLPAHFVSQNGVNERPARKPPSRSPLVRAGLSALAIESSDAPEAAETSAVEADHADGELGLVGSAEVLEDVLGPLSWPGGLGISRTRAQQQEQMKRLAGPRPVPEAADSPVAPVKKSAAQQREYCSHLSAPRQRPQSARDAEFHASEMLTEQHYLDGMPDDSAMPKRMRRACSVPSRPAMPYEVSVLPADLKLAIRRSMRQLRASKQQKLPRTGSCSSDASGPSEAALQEMLAMLDKMEGADAEQADSILATVRKLYAGLWREDDCSKQLPKSNPTQVPRDEFSEPRACQGSRHLSHVGPKVETTLSAPDPQSPSTSNLCSNEQPPTEARPRRTRRRTSMSHWMPEDMTS